MVIDARTTIAEVCTDHGVTLAQLYGCRKDRRVVSARRDFARRMFEGGICKAEIARLLGKDEASVRAYLYDAHLHSSAAKRAQ